MISLCGCWFAFAVAGLFVLPLQLSRSPKAKLLLRSAGLAIAPAGLIALCMTVVYAIILWNIDQDQLEAVKQIDQLPPGEMEHTLHLAASGSQFDALLVNPVFITFSAMFLLATLMFIPAIRKHWLPFLLLLIPAMICGYLIGIGLFEALAPGSFGFEMHADHGLLFFLGGVMFYFLVLLLSYFAGRARERRNAPPPQDIPPAA